MDIRRYRAEQLNLALNGGILRKEVSDVSVNGIYLKIKTIGDREDENQKEIIKRNKKRVRFL
jgi:hypothetical protein